MLISEQKVWSIPKMIPEREQSSGELKTHIGENSGSGITDSCPSCRQP